MESGRLASERGGLQVLAPIASPPLLWTSENSERPLMEPGTRIHAAD